MADERELTEGVCRHCGLTMKLLPSGFCRRCDPLTRPIIEVEQTHQDARALTEQELAAVEEWAQGPVPPYVARRLVAEVRRLQARVAELEGAGQPATGKLRIVVDKRVPPGEVWLQSGEEMVRFTGPLQVGEAAATEED